MVIKNTFNEQCITYSQMNMIYNSRLFWRRYTTWIRVYIISRYLGTGTEEESFRRVYFETSDIGNILELVFDRESANTVSQLLNQFTYALRDLITAQLQGNNDAVNQNVTRLYQVGANLASFLNSVNPYINETEWRNMMEQYIQYTIEQLNPFISGDYSRDIEAYMELASLTDRMGDYLAQSLLDYINAGFSLSPQDDAQCITYEQVSHIFIIRMLWYSLANWTRAYMLSRYSNIGNTDEVKARLMEIPTVYINALEQFFGVNLETYLQLLNTYFDLIDNLITAQQTGNISEINHVTQLLYQHMDQRAAIIASLNPSLWDKNEWRTRLYNHLRYTIDESTAFLTGNYNANLDIFRAQLDHAESTSSFFARGLFDYLMTQKENISRQRLN